MTALEEYDRIEATGLWRATPKAQRREVIVSIGNATLKITDHNDTALAHWSLAAIQRANTGSDPAIFHPDGDKGETLELAADEAQMIAAIEKLRQKINRTRPHPGRFRLWAGVGLGLALLGLALFWLPGAARDHALRVVPAVKRAELGASLLARITRVSGLPCAAGEGSRALRKLGARLPSPQGAARLVVLPGGVREASHLPGGVILLNRALIEDFEEPDVVAGYIIAEHLTAGLQDPLADFLNHAGVFATAQLLTTGHVGEVAQDAYARHLLTRAATPLPTATLLAGFSAWSVRASPYAYARDITGEETLALIEADPFAHRAPEPLLSDNDWLRLQAICGG